MLFLNSLIKADLLCSMFTARNWTIVSLLYVTVKTFYCLTRNSSIKASHNVYPKSVSDTILYGTYTSTSEDRWALKHPVNSSIIWCPSSLIKHIIEQPQTNDSDPIAHESRGFAITTTWPRCGLTCLKCRVRVYPLFTAVTLLPTALAVACLSMWLWALPKTVGGKKCNYCKIIILLPFDFSQRIHEYIWIHLASQSEIPPVS